VTISYNACNDGYGEVLNGSMSLVFNTDISNTNTFDYFDFNMTISFDNFRSTIDGYGTVTIDGDMTVATTIAGNLVTFSMSGNSFYVVDPDQSSHLTNFSFSFTLDQSTFDTTIDSNFTIASTALNGQITVDVYFEIPFGSTYPVSGSLSITGDNSQLVVSVVGDGTVDVTLSINGIVQAGYPKNITWAELGVVINDFIF